MAIDNRLRGNDIHGDNALFVDKETERVGLGVECVDHPEQFITGSDFGEQGRDNADARRVFVQDNEHIEVTVDHVQMFIIIVLKILDSSCCHDSFE